MKPVKKVELVVDSQEVSHLLDQLSEIDIKAYTVIREAHGKGDRGTRGGDFFLGAFDNSYVMIACSEEQAKQIVETARPLLKRIGGICLVSDAMWVLH
jgi:nitrogen regulatory protein PII